TRRGFDIDVVEKNPLIPGQFVENEGAKRMFWGENGLLPPHAAAKTDEDHIWPLVRDANKRRVASAVALKVVRREGGAVFIVATPNQTRREGSHACGGLAKKKPSIDGFGRHEHVSLPRIQGVLAGPSAGLYSVRERSVSNQGVF